MRNIALCSAGEYSTHRRDCSSYEEDASRRQITGIRVYDEYQCTPRSTRHGLCVGMYKIKFRRARARGI